MTRLCIIPLAIVCLGVNKNTYAEIRNGYENEIIADYIRFYKKTYQNKYLEGIKKGHHPDDPGHNTIEETLIAFKASWIKYNKEMKRKAKIKSRKSLASTRED